MATYESHIYQDGNPTVTVCGKAIRQRAEQPGDFLRLCSQCHDISLTFMPAPETKTHEDQEAAKLEANVRELEELLFDVRRDLLQNTQKWGHEAVNLNVLKDRAGRYILMDALTALVNGRAAIVKAQGDHGRAW